MGNGMGMMTEPSNKTMSASIQTEYNGSISAFNSDRKLVMNFGRPVVNCWLEVKQLQNSITTLEQLLPTIEACHQGSMVQLLITLKSLHQRHELEHNQMTEATAEPTADDQMAYLVAYAAAVGGAA